jgi:phage baseplate assembly protein W
MVMDAASVFGQGISFPPRLGADGRVALSAGPDNIRESIHVILLTEPGERLQLPGFGGRLRTFLFEPNTVATRRLVQEEIVQALRQWEPRITVQSVVVEADEVDSQTAIATVFYELIATQTAGQVSLRVPLGG